MRNPKVHITRFVVTLSEVILDLAFECGDGAGGDALGQKRSRFGNCNTVVVFEEDGERGFHGSQTRVDQNRKRKSKMKIRKKSRSRIRSKRRTSYS
jgi:hypothetical protein